jgi:hypothetical protein
MEVQIESISSTPTHLRISMLIRGPKHSWVKFAEAVVPIREVPFIVIRDLLAAHGPIAPEGILEEDDELPLGLEDDTEGLPPH